MKCYIVTFHIWTDVLKSSTVNTNLQMQIDMDANGNKL